MKTIYCYFNLFDMQQWISLYDEETKDTIPLTVIPTREFSKNIVLQCHKINTKNIHLYGNEQYLNSIAEEIKTIGKTDYSYDDMIVEVN